MLCSRDTFFCSFSQYSYDGFILYYARGWSSSWPVAIPFDTNRKNATFGMFTRYSFPSTKREKKIVFFGYPLPQSLRSWQQWRCPSSSSFPGTTTKMTTSAKVVLALLHPSSICFHCHMQQLLARYHRSSSSTFLVPPIQGPPSRQQTRSAVFSDRFRSMITNK